MTFSLPIPKTRAKKHQLKSLINGHHCAQEMLDFCQRIERPVTFMSFGFFTDFDNDLKSSMLQSKLERKDREHFSSPHSLASTTL